MWEKDLSSHARDTARIIEGPADHPEVIAAEQRRSQGLRDFAAGVAAAQRAESEAPSHSHAVRLDKKTLSRAARILDMALAMAQWEVSATDRLDFIADLYEKLIARGRIEADELLEITEELSQELNEIKRKTT